MTDQKNDDVTIRDATAADIPRLAHLRFAFRSVLGEPDETEEAFVARCEPWMRARLNNGHWFCWVAESRGVIIGNVWLSTIEKMPNPLVEAEENAYITNFFVLEEARAHGIGSRLLAQALAWSESRGCYAVILWPTDRGRPLYERHGFSANGEVMQLHLPPPSVSRVRL